MDQKVRIAVSGAGGGVGQSIIKALQGSKYDVVALDGEVLGAGLYAADTSYVIPYASDPSFIPRLMEICQQEHCTLFFPGLDAELPVLTQATDQFKAIGTTVVVSAPDVVELGDNKLITYQRLTAAGINVPQTIDLQTYTSREAPLEPPFILKRKVGGARSKDVFLIKTTDEYDAFNSRGLNIQDFIAQVYIEGDEYTCGSINLDGVCKGVIVMRRILRDGDTYKCFSVQDESIDTTVRTIMHAIKPFGACNVQLRVKDGVPYVFEINARCSGTTGARALCGFNEPLLIANYLVHGIEPAYAIKEQTILRYWKELVVDNDLISKMKADSSLQQASHTQL